MPVTHMCSAFDKIIVFLPALSLQNYTSQETKRLTSKNIIDIINGKDQKVLEEYFYYLKSKIKINKMQFSTEKLRVFTFTLWISLISITKAN